MVNNSGTNQHGAGSLLKKHLELPDLIADCQRKSMTQKAMLEWLESQYNIKMKKRTLQKIITDCGIATVRRNDKSKLEQGEAIVKVVREEDPLHKMGKRKIKGKLALTGVFVPTNFTQDFLREIDKDAVLLRQPSHVSGKKHKTGLWSAGPNEEWAFDGHDKIRESMGLDIYGGIDKYARFKLGLWVVPNNRLGCVAAALYVLSIKKHGGCPLQSVTDLGSETGGLAAIQNVVRQFFVPALDSEVLPAHRHVKSTENISIERPWRDLFQTEFANALHLYVSGKFTCGFHPGDPFHVAMARWIWAQAVQERCDRHVEEYNCHVIRKQKKILLPSGASPRQFYFNPTSYGGENLLIPIPPHVCDELVKKYVPDDLFQFGTSEEVNLFEYLYAEIQSPKITCITAWPIFSSMLEKLEEEEAMDIEPE